LFLLLVLYIYSSVLLFSFSVCHCYVSGVFFFQAEDGIRDDLVTGVQTCALPICSARPAQPSRRGRARARARRARPPRQTPCAARSEERRVGKECRARWWPGL